jgi:hypothetical protein
VFTEPLPWNDMQEYTYIQTDWWEGFIKYDVEMGEVAMLYIPSFITIVLGIRKLVGAMHKYMDSMVIA